MRRYPRNAHWFVYKSRSGSWAAWKFDPISWPDQDLDGAHFTTHKAALAYAISHAYPTAKDKQ